MDKKSLAHSYPGVDSALKNKLSFSGFKTSDAGNALLSSALL